MTVTSNIHVGLPAWSSQVYAAGTRVSTGGNAYQCIVSGLSTVAPVGQGSQISETATQIVPNPTETGTANGVLPSPGVEPTGWDLANPTFIDGMTLQITNHGADASTGFNFLDLQISGMSNGTDINMFFVPVSGVTALPSRSYTQAVGLAIVGGSTSGISQVFIDADNLDSNGNFISGNERFVALTGTVQQFTNTFTTTSNTGRLNPRFGLTGLTNGASISITVRIEQPTCTLVTGPAVWKWLSAINFTTVQGWVNSWPATLVDNMLGLLWNDGPITTTAGTSYMVASGHTMGAFTATLTCAPGESFRDSLRDNDYPFLFDSTKGVSFVLPSAVGNVNYVNITDSNVTLDGLQFQDPNPISNSTIWNTNTGASGAVLRNCICDGYGQANGANILSWADATTLANVLVVDRQTGSSGGPGILITGTAAWHIANCTIVAPNGPSQSGVSSSSSSASSTIRNTACLGYFQSFVSSQGTVTADHCVVSDPNLNTSITDGGGNFTSRTISGQFFVPPSSLNPWSSDFSADFGPLGANPFSSGFSSGFGPGAGVATDFRPLSTGDLINHGTTDLTDVPTADDAVHHPRPQSINWDVGAWELVLAGPSPGPLVGRQIEQPDINHRLSVLRAGVVGTAVQLTSVLRSVIVRQQQPDQPLPVLRTGVTTPTVLSSARPFVNVRQEQPRDSVPGPFFWGQQNFANVATLGQVGKVVVREQENPPRIAAIMWRGIYGPNVAPPPHIGAVVTRQELPGQPPSLLIPSIPQTPATTPRNPGADTLLGRQELPSHPAPSLVHSLYGQNARAPVSDAIAVRQQQPDQPPSVVQPGPPGAIVKSPTPNILGRQQIPDQPLPLVLAGVPPTNPPPPGPIIGGTSLLVRQQQPDQPSPVARAGVQGPNVRPPVSDGLIIRQLQPDLLQPVVVAGPFGQLVLPAVTQAIVLRQQQPDQPPSVVQTGVQGPNVRTPITDAVLGRQQQPDQPPSVLVSAVQTGRVDVKVSDSVVTRQEQPGHPASVFQVGRQGPNVYPKVADSVAVRQEQPGHPASMLLPSIPPATSVAAPQQIGRIVVRQEQPGHPVSVLSVGVQTTTFVPATPRSVFVRQEQPGHPTSALMAGIYTNRKHVKGRTVRLMA